MTLSSFLKLLHEWRLNFAILSIATVWEILSRGVGRRRSKDIFSPQLQFNVTYFLVQLYFMPGINNWVIRGMTPLQTYLVNSTSGIRGLSTLNFDKYIVINPKISYILAGLTFLLFWDFFQYWVHRIMHMGLIFKVLHSFHHDVHMSVLNSFRHHPLELICLNFMLNLPVAMFISVVYPGVTVQSFWIVMTVFSLFLHADIEVPPIPLISSVMMLPNHHRVHHSFDSADFNKNFGQYFTIWDRLFGTYRRPIYGEKIDTGPKFTLAENLRSFFWITQKNPITATK
jgi:sterol desaturase/sphingolipid hydroxylase (fatty acid hydroxylase superfamily)